MQYVTVHKNNQTVGAFLPADDSVVNMLFEKSCFVVFPELGAVKTSPEQPFSHMIAMVLEPEHRVFSVTAQNSTCKNSPPLMSLSKPGT